MSDRADINEQPDGWNTEIAQDVSADWDTEIAQDVSADWDAENDAIIENDIARDINPGMRANNNIANNNIANTNITRDTE
ncbi:hypothetical protein ACFQVC_09770 [Streptomyces monticola]|uniref:Uncharacterized protein n=1 Tax=Streptomyces monticola TaxID=2666263 RepID=A0ABW2JEN0_9ACTN